MNMEPHGVKSTKIPNICSCCLTQAGCKDIFTEYTYFGRKEIYEDMLKDTFDVQISAHNGSERTKCFICEICITKLRDAYMFKQTVLQNQQCFVNCCQQFSVEATKSLKSIVQQECSIEDNTYCDQNGEHFQNGDSFCDNDVLANIKLPKEENALKKSKKLQDNRRKKEKVKDVKNDICLEKRNQKKSQDWLKIVERRGNGPVLRENSLKLIANSSVCVFQWHKSRYRCYCCKEPYSDMSTLREHTNSTHTLEEIEKRIILEQNRLVKVEISLLFCKICGAKLENLEALRQHLITHDIQFYLHEHLLVPFKIENNLKCQLCSQNFTMFRFLNMHMNKHYQKQVCHICGAGFSSLTFLNLHKTRTHRPLNCKICNLNFENKIVKKEHDVSVHNLKIERKMRFPCPYCAERFFQEKFRVEHLVEKHGMKKPEYKCFICPKVFITRSLLNNHAKNIHVKERNHECDICHRLFHKKSDVAKHVVTHTGEKKFSCNLCNSFFTTKHSLRRHMGRTHSVYNK